MAEAHDRSRPAAWLRGTVVLGAIPGVPPLLACLGLLLAWHLTAKLVALDSLPSPWAALQEVPAILGDREALLNILDSLRRMAVGFVAGGAARGPDRIDDGPQPRRRSLLQSAHDGDLSGPEGGTDADHHALARRRRSRQDAGDLPRRNPARDLPQLPRRPRGRGEDAVVGGRHGHGIAHSGSIASCCRRRCRRSWSASAPAWCWR